MRRGVKLGSLALVVGLLRTAGAAEVAIAPDRVLVVDGERTFVWGFYDNPDNDAWLDEIGGAGYNLVRCSANPEALDRLEARGLHVAAATVAGPDLILSCKLRHIVNLKRILRYNSVNAGLGYRSMTILSPFEVSYEDQDL